MHFGGGNRDNSMNYYYIMLVLVACFCYFANNQLIYDAGDDKLVPQQSASTKLCLLLVIAILTLMAGFRYHVGTDYSAYEAMYYTMESHTLQWTDLNEEPVALLISKISSLFGWGPQGFFMLFSVFTIVPVLISSYNEDWDYVLITLLLIFTCWWHGTFNGIRQYLAAAVIYCSRKNIKERKIVPYALACIAAYLCHKSSIVLFFLYFLPAKEVKTVRVLLVIIASLILSRSTEFLFNVVGFLNSREFIANEYATTTVSFFRTLVGCVPAMLALYEASTNELDDDQIFYVYMLVAHATIRVMTSNSAYLARLGIYTGAFVPMGLSKIMRSTSDSNQKVIRYIALILYFFYWHYEVSGSTTISEYEWFFGRR